MTTVATASDWSRAFVGYGALPPKLRVLHVTTLDRTGGWLAEALSADSAMVVLLDEAMGIAAGMSRLRDEAFDAILVSHDPPGLDALELVEGLRGAGADEPIIVLGQASEAELLPLCYEVGADAYVCVHSATTRLLIWQAARAVQRAQLERDHRRMMQAEQTRLRLEHEEAERLLQEQRHLLADLETLYREHGGDPEGASACLLNQALHSSTACDSRPDLPEPLVAMYREMLRTYVIMGSGNLATEMNALANFLVDAGISTRETLQLHLHVLAEQVRGLGARSARHVMTRAELLLLEVMVHVGEGYRLRYVARQHPPRQQMLPGFEDVVPSEKPVEEAISD
ncbi:MAG: hypothetical protein JSS27_06745 [Planctomycetes bacterium]|nr:hypothetical protein [Planctomycetota bacterium]